MKASPQLSPTHERETQAAVPGLELIGLTKRFGSTDALQDVSLAVEEGEFVTLLGPSGSGKTTCLRVIAGLERPDEGDVRIRGRSVIGVPIHRRQIGMVLQHYALFPHLTVLRNVMYPLKMRGCSRAEAERRAREALELVELEPLADRRPDQLSGGQQQRVAVARAIVFEPPVLVLDEPLAALDRRLRDQMQFELRRLHDELGTTLVYVTHDQSEALTMSDRIAVLKEGAVEQVGSPQTVYEESATRFVAEFLGEANVLEMSVTATNSSDSVLSDAAGRSLPVPKSSPAKDSVDLAIRVEHLGLADAERSGEWVGEVRQVAFLGDAVRYVVRCPPHDLVSKMTVGAGQTVFEPGAQVSVVWDLEAALLYPRNG